LSNAARNAKSANASKRKSKRPNAKPSSQKTPPNPQMRKQKLRKKNRMLTKKVPRMTTNQFAEFSRVLAHSKCTRLRLRMMSRLSRRSKVRKLLRLRLLLKLIQRPFAVAEAAERASVDAVESAREATNAVVVATSRWSGKLDLAHVRVKTRSRLLKLSNKSKRLSPPKRKLRSKKLLQPLMTQQTSRKILNQQLKKLLQRRVPQLRKRNLQQKRRRSNQLSRNRQLSSPSS
jgi:hypothetical protein